MNSIGEEPHGAQGAGSLLKKAVGGDWKGKSSMVSYLVGIALACRQAGLAQLLYLAVALLWFVPDRRIEHVLADHDAGT